jgi:serine/threonine protein kinase
VCRLDVVDASSAHVRPFLFGVRASRQVPGGKGRLVGDAPLKETRLLGDRYVLKALVGRGGMAEVYRAHDRMLDRSVAVKLMRTVAAGESERARFTDEARTLARLSHPGLVTILDAATADDEPYLVMELVNGPSLAQCCRGVALQPARVAAIGAQLADALGHAHASGVVHRDLKPGNVLLGADDRALLTDFGLARLISETVRHTTTGVTVGTPAYLAPEQVRGEEVGPATDVYSLGLVLLEALTGERAYEGLPIEVALARLTTPPTIPDTVPPPWHGLLRAMTALEPAGRPSTAEVAAALRDLASGLDPAAAIAAIRTESDDAEAPSAPSPSGTDGGETTVDLEGGPQTQPSRVPGHRPWLVGATVAALLLALAGASFRDDDARGGAPLPANVPERLEEPLRDLPQAEGRWVSPLETPHVEPARDGDDGDQPAQLQGAEPLQGSSTAVETLLDESRDEPGGSVTKPVGSGDGPDESGDAPVVPGNGPVAPEDPPVAPADEPVETGDPPVAPDDEPDEPEQNGNGNNGNGRGNSGRGNGNGG